jgi:serine protease Do
LLTSLIVSVFLGSIFGFLAAGLSEKNLKNYFDEKATTNNQFSEKESQSTAINIKEEDSFVVKAVEKSSPAVVSIIVTKDVPKMESYFSNPFFSDPFFDPFGVDDSQREAPEMEKREIGGGTGFIVSADGYIVTNRHVVSDDEADYTVMINDGTKKDAEVLAVDSFLDIAIIKIEQDEDLPFVSLGNSDELKIGQTVIAIGNSLGEFRNTVSKGIVSGLKRNLSAGDGRGSTELLEEVIQTDAAINPGNSGGPLLDLNGDVIGVNVAMAQGAENIGFSIPVNQVRKIYESVKETGKISRPYLGVRYVMLNEQIKEENSLEFDYGALILRGDRRTDLAIIPGSPADKAGLIENDIILEIDGKKITEEDNLAKIIREKEVGEEITLEVWSKGNEKVVKVVLEESL